MADLGAIRRGLQTIACGAKLIVAAGSSTFLLLHLISWADLFVIVLAPTAMISAFAYWAITTGRKSGQLAVFLNVQVGHEPFPPARSFWMENTPYFLCAASSIVVATGTLVTSITDGCSFMGKCEYGQSSAGATLVGLGVLLLPTIYVGTVWIAVRMTSAIGGGLKNAKRRVA